MSVLITKREPIIPGRDKTPTHNYIIEDAQEALGLTIDIWRDVVSYVDQHPKGTVNDVKLVKCESYYRVTGLSKQADITPTTDAACVLCDYAEKLQGMAEITGDEPYIDRCGYCPMNGQWDSMTGGGSQRACTSSGTGYEFFVRKLGSQSDSVRSVLDSMIRIYSKKEGASL